MHNKLVITLLCSVSLASIQNKCFSATNTYQPGEGFVKHKKKTNNFKTIQCHFCDKELLPNQACASCLRDHILCCKCFFTMDMSLPTEPLFTLDGVKITGNHMHFKGDTLFFKKCPIEMCDQTMDMLFEYSYPPMSLKKSCLSCLQKYFFCTKNYIFNKKKIICLAMGCVLAAPCICEVCHNNESCKTTANNVVDLLAGLVNKLKFD